MLLAMVLKITWTSTSTILFSLFPSLLLQPTIAKSQSKVKQYDSICYSNALKSKKFSLNQQFLFFFFYCRLNYGKSVIDEFHFILECPLCGSLRDKLLSIICLIDPAFEL